MEKERTWTSDKKVWAWENIEQSLRNVLTYASYIDNRTGERDEVERMAEHFIRSARWHRRRYE